MTKERITNERRLWLSIQFVFSDSLHTSQYFKSAPSGGLHLCSEKIKTTTCLSANLLLRTIPIVR